MSSQNEDQQHARYSATRLLFRREVIERLAPEGVLTIDIHPADGEPFAVSMTRKQFEQTFAHVLTTRSWAQGNYHYPTLPSRARAFITDGSGGQDEVTPVGRSVSGNNKQGRSTHATSTRREGRPATSIRRYFRPYSILRERKTTIAHTFASAIAPIDNPTPEQIDAALEVLTTALRDVRRSDSSTVLCVYCDAPAEDWDHLEALVTGGRTSGYGHTLGNLVPSCKNCNTQKGNKPWRDWLRTRPNGPARIRAIEQYIRYCAPTHRPYEELCRLVPDTMRRYEELQAQILTLMAEADQVAAEIRDKSRLASEAAKNDSSGPP